MEKKEECREYFLFKDWYLGALNHIAPTLEVRTELTEIIIEYGITGIEPDWKKYNSLTKVIFEVIKEEIDKDNKELDKFKQEEIN